jgi:hypothetical protein
MRFGKFKYYSYVCILNLKKAENVLTPFYSG